MWGELILCIWGRANDGATKGRSTEKGRGDSEALGRATGRNEEEEEEGARTLPVSRPLKMASGVSGGGWQRYGRIGQEPCRILPSPLFTDAGPPVNHCVCTAAPSPQPFARGAVFFMRLSCLLPTRHCRHVHGMCSLLPCTPPAARICVHPQRRHWVPASLRRLRGWHRVQEGRHIESTRVTPHRNR